MIRRLLLLCLVCGLWAAPSAAQVPVPSMTKPMSTSTCPDSPTGTGCLTLLVQGYSGVSVQLTGTWTGTVTFEACVGQTCSTFQPLLMTPAASTTGTTTATANGVWFGSLGGASWMQVRFSTPTSGTVTAAVQASVNGNGSGGGGGGGTGNVVGPATSTDGVPALFDGTTGLLLKNSTPTGTGNPVLQTSPTLTTPVLGTATATAITTGALTDSALTSTRLTTAGTAGLLQDYSTMTYVAAYTGPFLGNLAHATLLLDQGFNITTSRTSATGTLPMNYTNVDMAPASNMVSTVQTTAIKAGVNDLATETHDVGSWEGADIYIAHKGTGGYGTLIGAGGWAESTNASTGGALIGLQATADQTHASGVVTNMVNLLVDGTASLRTNQGTVTTYAGGYITDLDITAGFTVANRYALFINTMSGAAGTLDFAIRSAATQPSYFSGSVGIGATPTSPLAVTGTGLGTYTEAGGTTDSADISSRTTVTAKSSNAIIAAAAHEFVSNASTIAAGTYTMTGIYGLAFIPGTDTAAYPSGSSLVGGTFVSNYKGATSIVNVVGVQGSGVRNSFAGTGGTVDHLVGVQASTFQLENSGTTALAAAFYATQPLGTGSGTITLQAGLYLEDQKPASGTTTAAYGIYQAGVANNRNFFGGTLETGNYLQMTEMTAPSAGAADTVRIYAVDNGGGKTQLMALFSSGAAVQIAIQP